MSSVKFDASSIKAEFLTICSYSLLGTTPLHIFLRLESRNLSPSKSLCSATEVMKLNIYADVNISPIRIPAVLSLCSNAVLMLRCKCSPISVQSFSSFENPNIFFLNFLHLVAYSSFKEQLMAISCYLCKLTFNRALLSSPLFIHLRDLVFAIHLT